MSVPAFFGFLCGGLTGVDVFVDNLAGQFAGIHLVGSVLDGGAKLLDSLPASWRRHFHAQQSRTLPTDDPSLSFRNGETNEPIAIVFLITKLHLHSVKVDFDSSRGLQDVLGPSGLQAIRC